MTPLQLAVAYSALANGGTVVRPHVASAILRGESVQMLKFPPVRKVKLVDRRRSATGLYQAAHSPAGTSASLFANFPVPVAGKTGTAEAGAGRSDHSWYASWAPANNPKVVVVVLVAHGGFGAEAAGARRARHLPGVLQAEELEAVALSRASTPGRNAMWKPAVATSCAIGSACFTGTCGMTTSQRVAERAMSM